MSTDSTDETGGTATCRKGNSEHGRRVTGEPHTDEMDGLAVADGDGSGDTKSGRNTDAAGGHTIAGAAHVMLPE